MLVKTGQVKPFSFSPNYNTQMRMNILEDLFFYTGPGIQALYRMGFIPKENEFREMTEEEYSNFLKEYPEGVEEKILVAKNRDKYGNAEDLIVVTESQLDMLKRASKHLHNLASGEIFEDDEEMLIRLAKALPPVFTRGTRFAQTDQ